MKNLVHRLRRRGWEKKEIVHAVEAIKQAKKTKVHAFLEARMFWIILIAVFAANFAISVAMLPVMIVLKGFGLYFTIIVLGLVFGLLFELVIRSIEHFEREHHLWLAVLIPMIALFNIFLAVRMSNKISVGFGISIFNNPVLVGIVYSVSFVFPFIFYRFVLEKGYYSN